MVIADTGAGPNIFRLTDVASVIAEFGLEAPQAGLVTADGSALAGLCGSATVQIRFSKERQTHSITAQILDRQHLTPLIGMEFWKLN